MSPIENTMLPNFQYFSVSIIIFEGWVNAHISATAYLFSLNIKDIHSFNKVNPNENDQKFSI